MPRKLNEQKFCSWCGSEVIYKAEWMSECPNCGYNNYVNPKPCTGIIIVQGGKAAILQRARQPELGKFDLPGGFIDVPDPDIETGAYREVEEEMGIPKGNVSSLRYLGSGVNESYLWQDSEIPCIISYFVCELKDSEIKLDKDESSDFRWITARDLPEIDFSWDIDRQMLNKYFKEGV